jgi:tetratricopeptide (TPR) repeat protein
MSGGGDRATSTRSSIDELGLTRWRGSSGSGHAMMVDHIRPSMQTDQFRLPPDVGDLVGRDDIVAQLEELLDRPEQASGAVVSSIAGRAGVGKTALAVRVAQRVRPSFPDGQIYVNLGGPEERPLDPDDVLGEILLELGVARKEIPDGLADRTGQYRNQLEHRRVLLLLDNAAGTEQVEPLLPDSPGSAALITSRSQLGGLRATPSAVTHSMVLDVLDEDQAIALLAQVMGAERVDREPDAARRIVALCGYLPLAVRIAGARLAGSRQTSLAMFASRLDDAQIRLAELRIRDLEVRASFALNYESLRADERRLFRLLGLVKAPDFPDWVAAALLDCQTPVAEDLIRRLVGAEVLGVARQAPTGNVRYRFHDLLRVLARDHLWTEETREAQDAALGRVLDVSLALASHAAELLEPGPRRSSARPLPATLSSAVEWLEADPAAWFDDERIGLLATLDQAADNDRREETWELARALTYFFKLRTHWTDWHHSQQLGLRAAREAGDERATANALRSLGDVHTQLGQLRSAASHFEEALELFGRLGDDHGRAWTLVGLGGALHEQNRYDPAAELLQEAIDLFGERASDRRGEAWAQEWLGVVRRYQERREEALALFRDSLEHFRAVGDRRGEAYCLVNLGAVDRDRQQFDDAMGWLDQAEPIFRELSDQQGAAYVLLNRGHMLREQERLEEAEELLTDCAAEMRRLGDRSGEAWTRFNLGMVYQGQGRDGEAMDEFGECQRLFNNLGVDRGRAMTAIGVGYVQLRRHEPGEAATSFRQALAVLPDGEEMGVAKAQSGLGLALAASGEDDEAAMAWRSALAIFRRLGSQEAVEVEAWLAGGR